MKIIRGSVKNYKGNCYFIALTVCKRSFGLHCGYLNSKPLWYWKRHIFSNITNQPALYRHFNLFKTKHLFIGFAFSTPTSKLISGV